MCRMCKMCKMCKMGKRNQPPLLYPVRVKSVDRVILYRTKLCKTSKTGKMIHPPPLPLTVPIYTFCTICTIYTFCTLPLMMCKMVMVNCFNRSRLMKTQQRVQCTNFHNPLSFAYSVRNRGGYIPLPPLLYTHPRSEIHAKETPSTQRAKLALASRAFQFVQSRKA